MVAAWILVALAAALLKTGYNALQKRLTFDYDGLALATITSILGFVFMLPVGVWYLATTEIRFTLPIAGALLFSGAANVVAIFVFLSALEREDLSVVGPLVQTTPLLVAVAEPFLLATAFDVGVLLGAVAAVVGAYVLLVDAESFLTPLARVTSPPALLALSAASIYAGVNIANRFIATQIPPLFYAFSIYLLMAVGFVALRAGRSGWRSVPTRSLLAPRLALLGGLTALRTSVTYVAFSLAAAARVSIVLQTAIVLNVLAGGLLFGEQGILRKLAGAGLIVAGIVLAI